MMYEVEVSHKAEIEMQEARYWYEEQSIGLGEKFINEIQLAIDSLRNPILDHKLVYEDLRRVLLKRFPYTIYYMRDAEQKLLRILTVLHNKQSYNILIRRD